VDFWVFKFLKNLKNLAFRTHINSLA